MAAAACWGLADFFVAVITRRIGTLRTLVIMQLASAVGYSATFIVIQPPAAIVGADWFAFGLLSILVLGNYLAFYKALEIGPVAIVTPIVAAYAAVVVLLALLLLDERLSPGQGAGAALAIAGVVLASADFRRSLTAPRVGKGVLLSILSLIGFGLTSFVAGFYARKYNWLTPAVIVRLMTTGLFLGLAASRRTGLRGVGARLIVLVSVVGIIEAGGFLFFARGAELGYLAIAAAASASYPLIPLVLGITVLHERLAPNQWIGVVSVIAGVIMLALF